MTDLDRTYFERRAAEERSASLVAHHPAARRSHLELAARYAALLAATQERQAQARATMWL